MSLHKRRTAQVGYLLKKFPRLSETFILNEILGQEARGLALRVFSRRRPDSEPRHPQLSSLRADVEVLPGVREIDPWNTLFADDWSPDELYPRVRALVDENRERPHPRFSHLLVEALYLLKRCRDLDLRHLHVHFASDAAMTAMLLRRLGGPSFSLTTHAKDIYRNAVDTEVLDRIIEASDFTITVCDANVRHLRELLSPKAVSKVRRLYNGIDLSRFGRADNEARDKAHVLTVARLVEKKGLDVLIDAFGHLQRHGVHFTATIVGQGEERESLERRAVDAGLNGRIRWTGALDQGAVTNLLSEATVFCLPCVIGADGNRDALPTVLLEALASGVPAVSTPISGVPEILDNGRAGVLVPPNDALATARGIQMLLSNPDSRERLASAGRRRAAKLFDSVLVADELGGWLDESIRERPKTAA